MPQKHLPFALEFGSKTDKLVVFIPLIVFAIEFNLIMELKVYVFGLGSDFRAC